MPGGGGRGGGRGAPEAPLGAGGLGMFLQQRWGAACIYRREGAAMNRVYYYNGSLGRHAGSK